jgi:hypothetical protein
MKIANLKDGIARRRIDDSFVTARFQEELDFFSNTRKEDRIVVSELTSQIPMSSKTDARKKWLKGLVRAASNKVDLNSLVHIVNVMQGWKGSNNVLVVEVRMDSTELA